jgi:hypothetical protein
MSHYTVVGGCVVIFRFDPTVGRLGNPDVELWGV